MPIRVGRIQKQFQSSESAYMLFYKRKDVTVTASEPLSYLSDKIVQENIALFEMRDFYEKEKNCLIVRLNSFSAFTFNNGILNINNDFIDQNSGKLTDDILNSISLSVKVTFDLTLKTLVSMLDNITFDKIKYVYKISCSMGRIIILNRIEFNPNCEKSIKELEISHYSNILIVNEDENKLFENLNFDEVLEPISIRVVYKNKENQIDRYSSEKFDNFKIYLREYFKISSDFFLSFDNYNKKISLDEISIDKKTGKVLNLKQLKLSERIVFVTPLGYVNEVKNNNFTSEELITVIVKSDDDDELNILSLEPNMTFRKLEEMLKTKYGYTNIRMRKEQDRKIIFSEDMDKTLIEDSVFLEGGVRLLIEKGDIYKKNEFLIKVIVEEGNGANFFEDFICVAEIKIEKIKKVFCELYSLDQSNYKFFTTNWAQEPVKEIKREDLSLSTLKITDGEYIYLKNIKNEKSGSFVKFYFSKLYDEMFLKSNIQLIQEKKEEEVKIEKENNNDIVESITDKIPVDQINNFQIALAMSQEQSNDNSQLEKLFASIEDKDYIFKPVKDSEYRFCLEFSKETKISSIRSSLHQKLKEMGIIIDESLLRMRVISEKMEVQSILPLNSTIKSLNLYSPITFFVEILSEPEELSNKQCEIFLFERDVKNKIYKNKQRLIFNWVDSTPTCSYFYNFIELKTGLKNFSLAKYFKSEYRWEKITSSDENMKKGDICLKDGDFFAFKNEDPKEEITNKEIEKDDWQTKEDKEIGALMKLKYIECEYKNGKKQKKKRDERTIKLTLVD